MDPVDIGEHQKMTSIAMHALILEKVETYIEQTDLDIRFTDIGCGQGYLPVAVYLLGKEMDKSIEVNAYDISPNFVLQT